MKLYIFGSCSGTEPMADRHHTSLAFDINNRLYWFDAEECCSYTAHLMGVDLLKVSDIFISHPHMDHVGGLGELLWNIRKLTGVKKEQPRFGDITVYTPVKNVFDATLSLLKTTESNYTCPYQTLSKQVSDGLVFKNEDILVTALHNEHIPKTEEGYVSYSYCIKADGKKIVYSGDVKDFSELFPFLDGKTDLLLMETGHHSAPEVCRKILDNGFDIQKVVFLHHGREILNDASGTLERCKVLLPNVGFANDKDMYTL